MYSATVRCPHCGAQYPYLFISIRRGQSFGCKSCAQPIEVTQDMIDTAVAEARGDTGVPAEAASAKGTRT